MEVDVLLDRGTWLWERHALSLGLQMIEHPIRPIVGIVTARDDDGSHKVERQQLE